MSTSSSPSESRKPLSNGFEASPASGSHWRRHRSGWSLRGSRCGRLGTPRAAALGYARGRRHRGGDQRGGNGGRRPSAKSDPRVCRAGLVHPRDGGAAPPLVHQGVPDRATLRGECLRSALRAALIFCAFPCGLGTDRTASWKWSRQLSSAQAVIPARNSSRCSRGIRGSKLSH